MAYTKQTWVNNDPTKPLSATRLNKLETQYDEAISEVASQVGNSGSVIGSALSGAIAGEIDEALADFTPGDIPELGATIKKIERAQTDVVITVLGDSTGQGDVTTSRRWPYKFAQGLGAKFPAHSVVFVLWNSTTVAYDEPVTLQAGTNGRTITLYSGSASGETPLYSLTNLAALSPVRPDVVFINHGHNVNVNSYPTDTARLVEGVRVRHPGAPLVLISQNPRQIDSAGYPGQMLVRDAVVSLAVRLGLGLLDITSAFQAVPNYSTMLMSDTTHPNDAGYTLWANTLLKVVSTAATVPAKVTPTQQPIIHLPAGMFSPSSVATVPTLVSSGAAGSPYGGWAFDKDAVEGVGCIAVIPTDWEKIKVRLYWGVTSEPGGLAGAAVLRVGVKPMPTANPGAFGATHDLGAITTRTLAGTGEANKLNTLDWQADTAYELTERGQVALNVSRFATTGGDTLQMDVVFVGLDLIRVL